MGVDELIKLKKKKTQRSEGTEQWDREAVFLESNWGKWKREKINE
jgi:hypothetical protein